MKLEEHEPFRRLFEEALGKYSKDELAKILGCKVPNIYDINSGRHGLPDNKLRKLCMAMGKMEIWEEYMKGHKEVKRDGKIEYDKKALQHRELLKGFDGLTLEHQHCIIQKIHSLEEEERMEEADFNAGKYLYVKSVAEAVEEKMNDPLYPTQQVIHDAEKRFGSQWIFRRFEIRRNINQHVPNENQNNGEIELSPILRKMIIRYICAYDFYIEMQNHNLNSAAKLQPIEVPLAELEEHLASDSPIPRNKGEWGGAEVVIVRRLPEQRNEDYTYVVTKYSKELTWLFYQLKDIFMERGMIDHCSKFEFYGRLARTALKTLENGDESTTPKDLCKAVLNEAIEMAKEMKDGNFKVLMVAPTGVIAADLKEDN